MSWLSAVLPAVIGAAGSIIGGSQANKSAASSTKADRRFANKWNKVNLDHQRKVLGTQQWQFNKMMTHDNTQIVRRVKDAKAAGIHPLYAMGSSANYSPTITASGFHPSMPSGSSTGTALGEGMVQASKLAAEGLSKHFGKPTPVETAQVKALEAQSSRDTAQAAYWLSKAKTTEARANYIRPSPNTKAKTFPLKTGRALSKRPIESVGRKSLPTYVEAVGPRGRRRLLNPELGMDEIGAIHYAVDPLIQSAGSFVDGAKWKLRTRPYMRRKYAPFGKAWRSLKRTFGLGKR